MYRLPTSSSANIAIIAAIIIFLMSCGFVDLRPIEAHTSPAELDTVLSGEYSPLSVRFNTGMVKKEAENLLVVSSDTGIVEGDRFWNGNTLVFVPAAGWTAGTRYVMGLSGMARSEDGREIRLERDISFFALNWFARPVVERYSPQDGESVSAVGLCLELHFSQTMDRPSVESALSVEGMGGKKFEWSNDDKTIAIIPEKNLSPWAVYRWTLNAGAKSSNGVPMANAVSASFSTDLDRLMPAVSKVYPVIQSGGLWFPTGGSLEDDLGPGLGIAVEFNKPMDEAAFRSLRFEPSLAGRTEKLDEKSLVFVPTRDPEPETAYTLIIPGDTRDSEGLKIGTDYRHIFVADIPWLRILSVNAASGDSVNPHEVNVLPVPVSEADGGLARFTVHFSLMFGDEAKQKTALAISLLPFFPGNLDPIALRYVSWIADDRMSMGWERLKPGASAVPHYYTLRIPGGRGGITNGGGMYLQNDLILYLEAIQ